MQGCRDRDFHWLIDSCWEQEAVERHQHQSSDWLTSYVNDLCGFMSWLVWLHVMTCNATWDDDLCGYIRWWLVWLHVMTCVATWDDGLCGYMGWLVWLQGMTWGPGIRTSQPMLLVTSKHIKGEWQKRTVFMPWTYGANTYTCIRPIGTQQLM